MIEILSCWMIFNYTQYSMEEVTRTEWPVVDCQDKLLWTASNDRMFSVQSFHTILKNAKADMMYKIL